MRVGTVIDATGSGPRGDLRAIRTGGTPGTRASAFIASRRSASGFGRLRDETFEPLPGGDVSVSPRQRNGGGSGRQCPPRLLSDGNPLGPMRSRFFA